MIIRINYGNEIEKNNILIQEIDYFTPYGEKASRKIALVLHF